jgi:hypothetical protein
VLDEVSLEFGLKVSGGVNWFFAKAQGEGTIKVTVKWAGNSASATAPGTGQDPGRGDVRWPGRGGAGDRSGVHRRAPRRSAIVVDPRYLLTAAHVLLRLDSGTGAKVPVEQVELEFPARELGGQPGRATASRLG